ncbi:hypothetical protein AAG906_036755 [Vitis piasezkii]|uniref:uncharacterized protein LOC117920920 n=1 Tax=Vitis riparia TaxID=96939 RepID=UPI00155A271E|nr:uncharacterized protein LOC117920920 [Vitis riparia]
MEESAKVQHVTKASSDQLLRKFAQAGGDDAPAKELRVVKRRKKSRRSREGHNRESPPNGSSGVVEKRSLLPPATRRSVALLLQLGIGRSQLRVRDLRNKSILGAIEKTWRRTIKGASKVLIERHYNQHKRLINEAM